MASYAWTHTGIGDLNLLTKVAPESYPGYHENKPYTPVDPSLDFW